MLGGKMRLRDSNNRGFWCLLSVVFVGILAVNVYSQAGSSSITGSVTDGQRNAIPGASVKLTSIGQNAQRTASTDSNGSFSFSAVMPGAYSIEVEAKGFKKTSVADVRALTDKPTTVAINLEVGDVSAVVEVNAAGIENIVNTQDASLGNNFESHQIQQLPIDSRNVVTLLSLQPGVTQDGSVTGGRRDQANITLDGVDVNDQQTGLNIDQTAAFTPVLRVTPDSIEEFRVTTANPDATKGRSAGAQVSLITKSGTNKFHGNVFEYHRNDATSANDWFNNSAAVARPKLIRNLFGGSLGGPILKDRLFFFYNYEGMREAKDQPVTATVPLASLGQGSIRFVDSSGTLRTLTTAQINSLTSNGSPVVDVNPTVVGIFASAAARYPANFGGGDGFNSSGFRFNAPLPVDQNTHTARIDWTATENQKHQLSFRGNYQQDLIGQASAFPDTPGTNRWSHPLGLAATYTWLVRTNMTNRFSYGLTRLAYSNQGDSGENAITFRDIYSPLNFARTFSRVNPTHNFTDDFTWIEGNHTIQFGTNIRIIRNKRTSLASAFDNGTTNFGFYPGSGNSLLTPLNQYLTANFGTTVASSSLRAAQSSLTAVLGRLNQYTANFIFDVDGKPVNGKPTVREWATEEYDFYGQDSWKFSQSLTINFGLRYGLSRPVYETQGFQAAPNIPLDVYFQRRLDAALQGKNYDEPLKIEKAGPANGAPNFYSWDKNNFQPRVSAAWSPNFKGGWLAKVFGTNRASVLRGGFAITNDYFGQQLAVQFDAANTLGFTSNYTTPANTFNITNNPAPLITGLGMNIRNLPGVTVPGNLTFPLQQPQDLALRIESSLDRGVQSPINYSWNVTYGRELPFRMYVEASYIGRAARHLLATRDVMMPNNLRDPKTDMTWYQAATLVEQQRRAGVPIGSVATIPYFDNLWGAGNIADSFYGPGSGLTNTQAIYKAAIEDMGGTDWTTMQLFLDAFTDRQLFYQSQYGALSSFGTVANSDYHAGAISLRQRLGGLTWDLNYTFSKSMDDTSGLQTSTAYGTAFILNPILQKDNYSVSDFDMRHIFNFNSVWQIPVGRGQKLFSDMNPIVDAILGGWQFSNIIRYNSGEPIGTGSKYFDNAGWVTNWQLKSAVVQIFDIPTTVDRNSGKCTGPNGQLGTCPNMFSNPTSAYASFRSPYPGETGDRNQIRFPSYVDWDAGLQKSFRMPWIETSRLNIKWEVFNVTNTPVFTGISNTALGYNPNTATQAPIGFGNFTRTKSSARVMQFAIRYDF